MRRTLQNIDWILAGSLIGLAMIGAIISTGQTSFVIVGLVGFAVLSFVPLRIIKVASWIIYGAVLLLTAFDLGGLSLSSEQLLIWATMFVLAAHFSNCEMNNWKGHVMTILLIALPMIVVINQFGLAALLALVLVVLMMMAAASQWRLLLFSVVGITVAAPLLWFVQHEYVRQRVISWLDFSFSPLEGYSLLPSLDGLGAAFVVSSMLLLGVLIWRIFLILRETNDRFAFSLSVGVTVMVSFCVLLNLAVLTHIFSVPHVLEAFVHYSGQALIGIIAVMGAVTRAPMEFGCASDNS